jgi:serine/threonine-protein kinase
VTELVAGSEVAGRYRVVRELARGGMGIVYEATDLKFDVPVALKVAGGPGADTASIHARLVREARLGALLGRTAGFVRVFDWGDVAGSGQVYLAMDLVRGARELDLMTGDLPERVARLAAAATIVTRLHQLGVIHRDLKPSNFLVADDGSMHLADFGIAKAQSDPEEASAPGAAAHLTATGTSMGTPLYMAPELFEDAKAADPRADVYALGVMLFQALTARLPYDGENAVSVINAQLRVRYQERSAPRARDHVQVPVVLDQLCARAMALDPSQRFADAAAFAHALERTEWPKSLGDPTASGARRAAARSAVTQLERPASSERDLGTATAQQRRGPCHACGADDGVRGERCVRCGASARLRTETSKRPSGGHPAVAAPTPTRLRDEVGAGLHDGTPLPMPKAAWFVIGIMLMVAVGLFALPTTPARSSTPGAFDVPVAPEEVPAAHRRQLELFEQVHRAWLARAAAQPEVVAVEALGLLDDATAAEARGTFVALTCVRSPSDRTPVTTGETRDYALRRAGEGPLELRRRAAE